MTISTKAEIASIATAKDNETIEVRVNELNNRGKVGYRIDLRKFVTAREEGAYEGFTREGLSVTREQAKELRDAIDQAIAEADSLAAVVTEQPKQVADKKMSRSATKSSPKKTATRSPKKAAPRRGSK